MDIKEAEEVLKEFEEVRPEMLSEKSKRLFYAIMKIANGRDEAEADLYESNNIIKNYIEIVSEKDKIIDLMAEKLTTDIHGKEWIIKYYTELVERR